MDFDSDTGESLLQLEIRKCQQAFAMSSHDEPEEFEDIQFFHRIPPVALSSFKIGGNAGDYMRSGFMTTTSSSGTSQSYGNVDAEEGFQDSESSYMFPENVMEYGEPQFFPGNCVGYLETILEETDEDCEEEEGSSGRHWWTPDSDTDTESVIRLEPAPTTPNCDNTCANFNHKSQEKTLEINDNNIVLGDFHQGQFSSITNSPSTAFPTTATSKPFEIEDLYLFDQLDLAFEETLMKPRRRSGFAFEAQLHLPLVEKTVTLESTKTETVPTREQPFTETGTISSNNVNYSSEPDEDDPEEDLTLRETEPPEGPPEGGNLGSDEYDDNEEPAVVNEEDFFCSSPSCSEDENSGLSETEDSSEESTTSSSDSEDKNSGTVLAEFSLNNFSSESGSGMNDCGEMYKNNHANPHRRSFEAPSKIRSFRSYDSLNSLAGTELLFSNPDTFPPVAQNTKSFQPNIEEILENGGESPPFSSPPFSGSPESRASSTEDKVVASRKNSGEASSENLSEDSGIHELSQQTPEVEFNRIVSHCYSKTDFGDSVPGYSNAEFGAATLPNYSNSEFGAPTLPKYSNADFGGSTIPEYSNTDYGGSTIPEYSNTDFGGSTIPEYSNTEFGAPTLPDCYTKSEFAINPLIYSSASEENSILSYNYCSSLGEVIDNKSCQAGHGDVGDEHPSKIQTSFASTTTTSSITLEYQLHLLPLESIPSESDYKEGSVNLEGEDECNKISDQRPIEMNREVLGVAEREQKLNNIVDCNINNGEGVVKVKQSGPMSTLEPSVVSGIGVTHPRSELDEAVVEMESGRDYYYEAELNSLLLLLPLPLVPGTQIPQSLAATGVLEHFNINTHVKIPAQHTSQLYQLGRPQVVHAYHHHHQQNHPSKSASTHPIYQNLQPYENPSRKASNILSECQSNFGPELQPVRLVRPVENRTSEDSDYVTLVRKGNEEEGNFAVGSSVSVSTLGSEDHFLWSEGDVYNDQISGQHQPSTLLQPIAEEGKEFEMLEPRASSPSVGGGVPIKTYGGIRNNDVAVYLVSSGSSRTPSPTVTNHDLEGTGSLRPKTVHFSPVVSEISWRESYAEPNPDELEPSYENNPKDHGQDHGQDRGQDHGQDKDHDDSYQEANPIEKVHVHSQVLSEPLPMVIPRTEKERLMALEPTTEKPVRMPMSIVPDLVSQCEVNAVAHAHAQGIHDEVDASTRLPTSTTNQGHPYYYQQQIFPSMFVATPKEAAEVNHLNFTKNGKKTTYVAPNIPASPSATPSVKSKNGKRLVDNDEPKPKPGFFQRLSKIRLSGNKSSKQKTKIFPKEIEPLNSSVKGNGGGNVALGQGLGPILKKGPPSPLVLQDNSTSESSINHNGSGAIPPPHDECSEAFENILEEIAGLNTILQRQQFPASTPTPTSNGGKRLFAERKQFLNTEVGHPDNSTLDNKLSQFKEDASRTRDQISRSHPDLEIIEGTTARRQVGSSPGGLDDRRSRKTEEEGSPSRGVESKTNEREWYRLLRSAAEKYYHGGRRGVDDGLRTGIVETDLDTGTSRELLDAELVILDEVDLSLNPPPPLPSSLPPANSGAKAQSLTNLTSGLKLSIAPDRPSDGGDPEAEERAKSLEFLLDEEQKSAASPPENKLQLDNRQLSEHELRIQRSLNKINVPDWYRRHSYRSKSVERDRSAELRKDTPLVTTTGTTALQLLKRNDYGSSGGLAGGWAGLSAYRTPSLSSLHNGGLNTGSLNRSNFVRGRPVTMSATRSSKESLLSPSSTASQSPSAFERSSFTYGMPLTMTRFGKGRLSSTSGTSPASGSSPSTPGQSSKLSAYVKQPYLGWRSQERLNSVGASSGTTTPAGGLRLSTYRPPAERLAADILARQKKSPARPTRSERPPLPKWPSRGGSEKSKTMSLPPPVENDVQVTHEFTRNPSPSIHDSIKEVSNAISEFVSNGNESLPRPQPRHKNVKKQALWFESSFVGKKSQTQ